MPIVPVSPAYAPTALTFSVAKGQVAEVLSGASTPEILAQAETSLKNALRWWDRFHPWHYLRSSQTTVTVTAGSADYNLESNFKHIFTVKTPARTLAYVPQRTYDRTQWNQDQTADPRAYTLFGKGQLLQITLLPTPGADTTLEIKYHRITTINPADNDLLDIPDPWIDVILDRARYLLLLTKSTQEPRARDYKELAREGIVRARADDLLVPDQSLAMEPLSGWNAPGYDFNHAWSYVLGAYGGW